MNEYKNTIRSFKETEALFDKTVAQVCSFPRNDSVLPFLCFEFGAATEEKIRAFIESEYRTFDEQALEEKYVEEMEILCVEEMEKERERAHEENQETANQLQELLDYNEASAAQYREERQSIVNEREFDGWEQGYFDEQMDTVESMYEEEEEAEPDPEWLDEEETMEQEQEPEESYRFTQEDWRQGWLALLYLDSRNPRGTKGEQLYWLRRGLSYNRLFYIFRSKKAYEKAMEYERRLSKNYKPKINYSGI